MRGGQDTYKRCPQDVHVGTLSEWQTFFLQSFQWREMGCNGVGDFEF